MWARDGPLVVVIMIVIARVVVVTTAAAVDWNLGIVLFPRYHYSQGRRNNVPGWVRSAGVTYLAGLLCADPPCY